MNRRRILLGLAAMPVAACLAGCGGDDGEGESDTPEYLFVQNADGVQLADGKLTLEGVNPITVYFADRPERIVGHGTTTEFVKVWGEGNDSFASNPPNAALSVLEGSDEQGVIVKLMAPKLDGSTLSYDVEVLDGAAAVTGGACSLVIDVIGRPLTPVSGRGTHRRVRRRHIRRYR